MFGPILISINKYCCPFYHVLCNNGDILQLLFQPDSATLCDLFAEEVARIVWGTDQRTVITPP